LSAARNVGLRLAIGAFVAFPDDDCWYSPHLLTDVAQWFASNTAYDFVSGQYGEPAYAHPGFPRMSMPITVTTVWECASSVTLFFRASVFRAGFRFDERLGAGAALPAGEETDLVL